jgi:hypothetical protein
VQKVRIVQKTSKRGIHIEGRTLVRIMLLGISPNTYPTVQSVCI